MRQSIIDIGIDIDISFLSVYGIRVFVRACVCACVNGQSGFGKEERQTLTDEEQAAKREERNQALSAQRDKVRRCRCWLSLSLSWWS